MGKLRVVRVGRGAEAWAQAACDDYGKRLRRAWGAVDETLVKPERFRGDVDAVRDAEAARILGAVKPRDRLVVLDERGEDLDTEGFTALLREGLDADGALVFCLGGPYGHGPAARDAAWRTVRLSAMVLNHEVARVVLYEQLYRATTLIQGVPYHH